MKRTLYIVGIVTIVILIAIWLFLIFADDSTKTDVYNRFGFTGTTEEGIVEDVIDAIIPDVFQKKYLRQLTTKRVIGYTEVASASSTLVYFVEGGTGHVYTIDPMIEGSETRISNHTVPVATKAAVAPDGSYVVVKSGNTETAPITIISLSGGADPYTINDRTLDFSITNDATLLYTTPGGRGVYGKSFDSSSRYAATIFEIPFRAATVIWGETVGGPHYTYPKASRYLEGYLYKMNDGKFSRAPISGFGLMAQGVESDVIYSFLIDDTYTSAMFNTKSNSRRPLAIGFTPEKCAFGIMLYCSNGREAEDFGFPDSWYRGEITSSDDIFKIDTTTGDAQFVVSGVAESGRELDMVNLEAGANDKLLYFINKKDWALWVYEFPPETNFE